MNKDCFSFEKLEAYKEARLLIKEVYRLQNLFPTEEKFALGSQVRRAAISITANLAEGSGRSSIKEKIHFIGISFGSLMEVFSELQVAQDLGYISGKDFDSLRPQFTKIAKMLSGLRNSFKTRLNP